MGGILMPYVGIGGSYLAISAPSQIPNLNLWYDASVSNLTNFNPAPADGGVVTAWVDKLGNGRDANQQATNRKPTWSANQQNGLGAIKFDGVNDVLTLNPIPWSLSLSGQTTYIVFKISATTDQMHLQATNTGGFSFFLSGSNWAAETAGGVGVTDAGNDTTKYHFMGMVFDGTQTNGNVTIQNNLRLRVRYDGVQRALTFSANLNTTTSATANTLNVGADDSGSANFLNGYLGEMMIWTRTLSAAEISAVESYLKNKWAI